MDDVDEPHTRRAAALAIELRATIGKVKRRLREQAGVGDLTSSQVSVLLRLEKDGPLTTSGLAQIEGMRPQSMSAIVAVLQAAGHIGATDDPSDGRRTLLALTDDCRTRVQDGRALRQDWLSRAIAEQLTPKEQDDLTRSLKLLKRIVGD